MIERRTKEYDDILAISYTNHDLTGFKNISEIKNEKLKSDDVILKHEFNYFDDRFGNSLNRKILLESGEDYINEDASDNKSMELNLINYYQLNSLKEKK